MSKVNRLTIISTNSMHINIYLLSIILSVSCIITSCVKTESLSCEEQTSDTDITIVPVEDALMKLDNFLSEVKMKSSTV